MCAIFGEIVFFSRSSGRLNGGQVVYPEEGRTSWGLDPFSTDVVDPCRYGFLILNPLGHGAVKITC